ncbi:hypothetical protein [Haloferax volcanii]|uniref:hypothetical protein n=1 Tax=Haloferax volcanii TaxID=2246 RepID=UPI0023DC6B6C|nr:hypothetical protein [Haloferax lucentense]
MVIVVFSFLVGLSFLVFGVDSQNEVQVFIALATVQGSFIAILISVFLLSLQVTASEFTPLSLGHIHSNWKFNSIIVLFVLSILTNVFYIQTLSDPLFDMGTSLNVEQAFAAGLGTFCLLLLLPAKEIMAELSSPETVLDSAVSEVEITDISSRSAVDVESAPERNPLLTIEQIHRSAKERGDEYTIQRSIYSMYEAVTGLLNEIDSTSTVDQTALFEHWKSCVDSTSHGNLRRTKLILSAQREIIFTSIDNDLGEYIPDRIAEMTNLVNQTYNNELTDSDLLGEFEQVGEFSIDQGMVHVSINVVDRLRDVIENLYSDESISGEKRDIVNKCSGITLSIVKYALNERGDEPSVRRLYRQSSQSGERTVQILKSEDNNESHRDTASSDAEITSTQRTILSTISNGHLDIFHSSLQVECSSIARHSVCVHTEVELFLGREPEYIVSQAKQAHSLNSDELELLNDVISELKDGQYSPKINSLQIEESDVQEVLDEFLSCNQSHSSQL